MVFRLIAAAATKMAEVVASLYTSDRLFFFISAIIVLVFSLLAIRMWNNFAFLKAPFFDFRYATLAVICFFAYTAYTRAKAIFKSHT